MSAALGLTLGGCYGGLRLDAGDPMASSDGTGGDNGGGTGELPDTDDSGGGTGGGVDDEPGCVSPEAELLAPLRRLTALEYDNTVRDLLGDPSRPSRNFTPDEKVAGFSANSVSPLSKSQLDQYIGAAEELAATAVTQRWELVVGCDIQAEGCTTQFVEDFGRRAFRRPLTDEQQAEYESLYETARTQWGETDGVAIVITAMLMSPNFLYHLEPTTGAAGELVALDDYALASRLSYFVWASMPDEELLDAAGQGTLTQQDVLTAQVRRMLDDPRADATVTSFHQQWMGTEDLASLTKDAGLFPEWDDELIAAAGQETGRFAAEIVRNGDASLRTLLTADWTVADASLANLYGIAGPAEGFAVVNLDPNERAGLLTQIGFLAANAHAAEVSWVHRGKFVREKMLCQDLPPPPPGVEVNDANDPSRLEDPNCSGCHMMMDPIGVGFDHYSPIGAFSVVDENGATIDASGEVVGVDEIGQFDGVIELVHALAESPQVHECMTKQWLRYAIRRAETDGEACTVASLVETFTESELDVRELMVAIAISDAFRFRTQP